jgi:hypothetical protein
VTYTIDLITFSLPSSDSVIDAIPLFEVEEVVKMTEDEGRLDDSIYSGGSFKKEKLSPEGPEKKSGDSNKVKFRNALQIQTKADGFNSGRQYIIQARSEEERKTVVENLTKLFKTATDKFLAKSQFAKAQASPQSGSACASQNRWGDSAKPLPPLPRSATRSQNVPPLAALFRRPRPPPAPAASTPRA